QALSDVGRALGAADPPPLVKNHGTIALDADMAEVDAMVFERFAASGAPGDLCRAAALYAGDLLDGFGILDQAFEDWLRFERQRLRDGAANVFKNLLAYEKGASAIATAQRLLALDPLQEEGHRALMRLHAEGGEIGLAIRQYDVCRELLKRELAVPPSAETEHLHRELRKRFSIQAAPPSVTAPSAHSTDASGSSKPSVAVLPFGNLSGDPAQQYFSDGITEDIITELSRFRSLTVIARHSSFRFRDESVELPEIARRLDVQYVVEGSVRRAADRLRITARLVEA